jgi:hypothetical protein
MIIGRDYLIARSGAGLLVLCGSIQAISLGRSYLRKDAA